MLHITNKPPLTDDEKFVISLVRAKSTGSIFEEPQFLGQPSVTEVDDFFVEIPEFLRLQNVNE